MNNKVVVKVNVPKLEMSFDVFIPISKKVSTILYLLTKSINELTSGDYVVNEYINIYNKDTKEIYELNKIIKDTNIRNGTELILL